MKNRTAEQIIKENKNNLKFSMYWDYRDELSEQQIMEILNSEDGLNEVENGIYEQNEFYILETENETLKQILTEEEYEDEDLREEIRNNLILDFNMEQLIKNSQINIRVELNTNEDLINFAEHKHSYTLKQFKRVFKNKYSKADYDKELLNLMGTEYGKITFYFKLRGLDILKLREQIQKGFIELRKGLQFGFFNSCVGGGSILEMNLKGNVKLNLGDWRYKNQKEVAMAKLKGEYSKYYDVSILGDNISHYGIEQTYGLGSWQEF